MVCERNLHVFTYQVRPYTALTQIFIVIVTPVIHHVQFDYIQCDYDALSQIFIVINVSHHDGSEPIHLHICPLIIQKDMTLRTKQLQSLAYEKHKISVRNIL